MAWKHNIELKGGDALQVASALEAKCIELITGDKVILDQKDKINRLGINVINAHFTASLPKSYTQPLLDTLNEEKEDEKYTTE